ncbi:MAG: hypothetical protein JXR96_22365 [Deltaproteobacteria bacterium]|nr:hypothetical protein [Deltaproteobacteria bacterium]
MGAQRTLDVRFPLAPDDEIHDPLDAVVYWTNHPECATGTRIEEQENPPVEYSERWFHIAFDLESLFD